MGARGTSEHTTDTVRDREAPGSNPGPRPFDRSALDPAHLLTQDSARQARAQEPWPSQQRLEHGSFSECLSPLG